MKYFRTKHSLRKLCSTELANLVLSLEDSIDEIVVCAVRYALPSHTYITITMTDFVKRHVKFISNKNLSLIFRDISEHLKDAENEHDTIGKPSWEDCRNCIGRELEKRGFSFDKNINVWEKTEEKK
jgi:hypothetical protein